MMRNKSIKPERDVYLEKLASDLEYAGWDIDTYEYMDQYGIYPTEEGYRDSFDVVMNGGEGLDNAIEEVEDWIDDFGPDAFYSDLLARLKERRTELESTVSKSWKLKKPAMKRPVRSKNEKRFCRIIFDIDDVNLSLDYSDIPTNEDDSLECVLQKYDEKYGTDFYQHLGDDAIALRWTTESEMDPAFRDAIPVRSWDEAEREAKKALRWRPRRRRWITVRTAAPSAGCTCSRNGIR